MLVGQDFLQPSRQALGPTQTPVQWVMGVSFPRVKQPRHGIDHKSLSSTKMKERVNFWDFMTYSRVKFHLFQD